MALPKSLMDGYRRYSAASAEERGRLEQLAALGQAPSALVIACCDARLLPQEIFDAGPGDLFIVRNVANLVPPYEVEGGFHGTSAAIEYAVLHLRVPHVVVMGHSRCGGIEAYRTGRRLAEAEGDHVTRWMSILEDAAVAAGTGSDPQQALEHAAIRASLANLRSFPALARREREGLLALHGVYVDIATSSMSVLDEAGGAFEPA